MKKTGTLKRELEVAFSRDTQPLWFRILKYLVLAAVVYMLWGDDRLWIILPALGTVGLLVHFWFRYKTNAWTRSYGPLKGYVLIDDTGMRTNDDFDYWIGLCLDFNSRAKSSKKKKKSSNPIPHYPR